VSKLHQRSLSFVVAVVGLGLTAGSASAAWTPAVELETGVGVAGLTVDPTGDRLVNTRTATSSGAMNTRILGVDSDRTPEGIRSIKGVMPDPIPWAEDDLLYARTSSLGTIRRTVPDGKGGTRRVNLTNYRIGVSVGEAVGVKLGTQRSVATAVLDQPVKLSGTAGGDVVMGWSEVGSDGVVRVNVAWRSARAKGSTVTLSEPQVISGSRSSRLLALSTGSGGRTVAVYETGATDSTRRLYVRPIDVRKGEVGKPQTLRRGGPGFVSATATVGPKGRSVIAWGEQDKADERTKPYVVRGTTRDRDGRFSSPKRLDAGGSLVRPPGGALVSAVDDAGRVTVAWNQTVGSVADGTAHDIPRVSEASSTGGLHEPRDLAAAGRVHGVAASGTVIGLVMVREQERPLGGSNADRGTALQVGIRPADGLMGNPETVNQFTDHQLLDRSNAYGAAAIAGLPDGGFSVAWTRATVENGKLRSTTYVADGPDTAK
jgi:hypothetical protein